MTQANPSDAAMIPRPLLLLGLVVALVVPQALLWNHTCDDAFISYRYLLNLRAGHGLVFNAGERVEGFSHPLWMALMIPALVLPNSAAALVAWGKIVGLACAAGTGWLMLRVLWRMGAPEFAVVAAVGLFLAAPGVHVHATAGLETPLLGLLLIAALEREQAGRAAWGTAVLLGLAALCRPEAALFGPLWGLWRIANFGWRGIPVLFMTWLAFPMSWQVFRLAYFGEWLPNPFYAKPPGTFGGMLGLAYLSPFILASLPPLVVLGHLSRPRRIGALAGLLTIPPVLLVVYTRGDWMPFGRFLIPVWALVCVQAARGLAVLPVAGIGVWLVAGAAVLTGALSLSREVPAYLRGDGLNEPMRGANQLAGGDWLAQRMAPGESVAANRLGGISYRLMDHRVVDMLGLADKEIARHLWRNGGNVAWATHPLASAKPDWIAIVNLRGNTEPIYGDADLEADLRDNYSLEGELPQGPVQVWQFYRRRPTS